jgi:hypothetical protein
MNPPSTPSNSPAIERRSSTGKKLLVTASVLLGIAGLTFGSATWWYQLNLNASPFKPVQLSVAEQQAVEAKIASLEKPADPAKTLVLNEREINGYLEQQGLGENLKVSIRNGNIEAQILTPVDPDVPLLGGHTVRVKIAVNTLLDADRRLALSLDDVSVGGISLPNAWLGNLKGMNLFDEANLGAGDSNFIKSFAAGIKDLQVRSGEIRLILND